MSVVTAIEQLAESCTMKELEKLAQKFLNKVQNEKRTTKQKRQQWAEEYRTFFQSKKAPRPKPRDFKE